MNTLRLSNRTRPAAVPAGFTLVELLTVIGIIAILAALTIPAVMHARTAAKRGAIAMEVNQLDMAIKKYKADFGEYPPDFAGVTNPTWTAAAQATVLRHFQAAFPRYVPGVSTGGALNGWAGFREDVLGNLTTDPWYNSSYPTIEGWGIDVNTLSPSTAIIFFLGGKPDWFRDAGNNYIYPATAGHAASAGFDAARTNQRVARIKCKPTQPV